MRVKPPIRGQQVTMNGTQFVQFCNGFFGFGVVCGLQNPITEGGGNETMTDQPEEALPMSNPKNHSSHFFYGVWKRLTAVVSKQDPRQTPPVE
jgi:hypothetical protein